MLDIGWQELIIVMVVSIIIIGPKDFPRIIKGLHKTYKNLRHYISEGQRTVQSIVHEAELDTINTNIKKKFAEIVEPIKSISDDSYSIQSDVQSIIKDKKKQIINSPKKKTKKSIKSVKNIKIEKTAKKSIEKTVKNSSKL